MTTLTENNPAGDFLLSEANGTYSRENEILAAGNNLQAGAVLGRLTASGKLAALDPAAATGAEDAAGILLATTHATTDVAVVAVERDAEVKADQLVWPAGISTNDKNAAIAQLAALGIVLR